MPLTALLLAPLLAVLVGCSRETQAERAREAFTRAAQGDAGACAAVDDPEMRGFCEFSAATAKTGPGGDCRGIADAEWRDECVFERADILSVEDDVVVALRLCAEAGQFRLDCARHVSVQAYRREGGLSPAFAAALREVAPELDVAGAWTGQTRHQVYVDRARHEDRFDAAACSQVEDRDDCLAAYAEVVGTRWRRLARQDARTKALLCDAAARGELPDDPALPKLRLAWEHIPAFDAAVRQVQRELCGG